MEPPLIIWQLRSEGRLSANLIRQIFAYPATTGLHLFPHEVARHALRRGGATSVHTIGVPLETLCFGGRWSFGSDSVYRYIGFPHEASPADFQYFWMDVGQSCSNFC